MDEDLDTAQSQPCGDGVRAAATAAEPAAACGCISQVDNMLREHNTTLVTTLFRQPDRVAVRTDKIDTNKRGRPATVIASYCPFCGTKYPKGTSMFDDGTHDVTALGNSGEDGS